MTTALHQHIVPFYGDDLVAVQQPDGTILVLFSRLCDNLGLRRYSQARRVQSHTILREGFVELMIQTEGGPQVAQCLRIDLLPLWLSGIQASKVKQGIQEKLVRYQRDAAQVLWQAFKPRILVDEQGDELTVSTDAELAQLVQIAEMGRAITRMAEEQLELRRRVDAAARAFKTMRADIANVQVRLGVLEDKLHPAAYITDVQAAEVSSQVKALAELLTGKDASKNHYQGIFGELYRRYGVASYKTIRIEQYPAVLAFLADWRASIGAS
ncbi:MAG: hypothetical protein RLZZ387_4789 [Chloroflexota bacterium]|jgi:hypothetical protein